MVTTKRVQSRSSLRQIRPMHADEFKTALDKIGFTQGEAAKFLNRSLRTINGYANGAKIDRAIELLLRLMTKLKLKPEEVS